MSDVAEIIKAAISDKKLYLITFFSLFLAIIVLGLSGILKIKTSHISIGSEQIESEINARAAKRIVCAENFLRAHKAKMRVEFPNTSDDKLNLIFALLEKDCLMRIYRNHITTDNNYVYDMTRSFLNIIRTNGTEDKTWSSEFAEYMELSVRELVESLAAIK